MEIHGLGFVYIWPRDQWKSMVGGLSIYGPRINGNPWLGVFLYMAPGSMEIHGLGSVYIWPRDQWKSMVGGLSTYGPGSMEIHGFGFVYIWPQDQWKSMVGGLSIYGLRINGNPWFGVTRNGSYTHPRGACTRVNAQRDQHNNHTRFREKIIYAMRCVKLVSLPTGRPQLDRIRSKMIT